MGTNYLQTFGTQNVEHSDGEMCPLVFGRTPSSVLTYIILVTHWNNCAANAT